MRWTPIAGATVIALLAACSATKATRTEAPSATPTPASPAVAASASLERLQAIMDAFKGTPDQRAQLVEALNASTTLTQQLATLANAGQLTAIDVVPPQRPAASPFASTIDRGRIVLSAALLTQVVKRRLIDVKIPDEILPNNLVFVLGGLAYHLERPPPTPQANMTPAAFAKARVEQDARAFIQGWNDVTEAAVRENGNRPLNVQQQGALLANLRYRAVLLDTTEQNKVAFAPSGMIGPTDQNVAAVAAIAGRTTVLDFGAP